MWGGGRGVRDMWGGGKGCGEFGTWVGWGGGVGVGCGSNRDVWAGGGVGCRSRGSEALKSCFWLKRRKLSKYFLFPKRAIVRGQGEAHGRVLGQPNRCSLI